MPLTTIHFHTKEGEKLNLGKKSEQIAKNFENSRITHLIVTDKVSVGRRIDLPIKSFFKIRDSLYSKKENLIFGLEFDDPIYQYHLLGLYMNPNNWENRMCPKKIEDICKNVEDSGGIIAIPHVYAASGLGENGLLQILDLYKKGIILHKPLIEISCYIEKFPSFSRGLRKMNTKAIKLAKKYDTGVFAGLDSRFSKLDLAYNESYEDPYTALIKATNCFDNGKIIPYLTMSHVPYGRENMFLVRDNLISFLSGGQFSLFKNFINKN